MAKRTKKEEDMAEPQQKATPVEPPKVREVSSPVSFFNDPRMKVGNNDTKDFAPHPVRKEQAGNDSSSDPEGDG